MAAATPHGMSSWDNRDKFSETFTDPLDESAFQNWFGFHAKKRGLNKNPDDGAHHYDYRSAYKAGASPDKTGHWPSEFKTLGHPDLVVQSDTSGQLVNTKTGERMWNPAYHDVPLNELFDLTKRPKMIARPRR